VSDRRPNLVLHVRAAEANPDPRRARDPRAPITGNRAALLALRDLVDSALEVGNSTQVFREADGEKRAREAALTVHYSHSRAYRGDEFVSNVEDDDVERVAG
jgi:hypothetical protein